LHHGSGTFPAVSQGCTAHAFPMIKMCLNQFVIFYGALFKHQARLAILDNMLKHLRPGRLFILGGKKRIGWRNPVVHSLIYLTTLVAEQII